MRGTVMNINHFASDDGKLYTSAPEFKVLRAVYSGHFAEIRNGAQMRASLRAGSHAFPGGYAIAYVTSDGSLLCPQCVRRELRNITQAIRSHANDGWRVVGCAVECDTDSTECCEHCNRIVFNPEED